MKNILWVAVCALLYTSCASERQIQVRFEKIRLVKIDTVGRLDNYQKLLTWQSDNNVKYYSFEDVDAYYPVGTQMSVLVTR